MSDKTKRVVIKVGTGVLTRPESGALNHAMMGRLIQSVADLKESGHQIVMVSSGAVGAGMSALDLEGRPEEVALLQACAAVGQARLMQTYDSGFRNAHFNVAQLLLTNDDFEVEKRSENVRNTLQQLLGLDSVVPIINENDSVAVFELRFGDNDQLSARVAKMIDADLLLVLTSVPGLRGPDAEDEDDIIRKVENLDEVLNYADDSVGKFSVGGMRSKLDSISIALDAGIETVIASGLEPEQLPELVAGGGFGTRFAPRKNV
ncbi:MAG: glutamate 5-kinase [Verrucomicrobiales bacterium]|jgi:glutamate 5-kinase